MSVLAEAVRSPALPPADGPPLADLLVLAVATVSAVSVAGVEACLDSSLCSAANLDETRVGVLTAASFSPPVRRLSATALLTDSDLLGGDLVAVLGVGLLAADVGLEGVDLVAGADLAGVAMVDLAGVVLGAEVGLAGVALVAEAGFAGALSVFDFPGT